jgi:hypothetical protein
MQPSRPAQVSMTYPGSAGAWVSKWVSYPGSSGDKISNWDHTRAWTGLGYQTGYHMQAVLGLEYQTEYHIWAAAGIIWAAAGIRCQTGYVSYQAVVGLGYQSGYHIRAAAGIKCQTGIISGIILGGAWVSNWVSAYPGGGGPSGSFRFFSRFPGIVVYLHSWCNSCITCIVSRVKLCRKLLQASSDL